MTLLHPLLNDDSIIVTQGFIGSTLQGETTTLGRGGSDFSSAIIAGALLVDQLQIWTDVSGVSTIDPRLTSEAIQVDELSYTEAAELAYLGAKILHPLTLLPLMDLNIPIYVGSSFYPEKRGTWIKSIPQRQNIFRSLAIRKDQCIITLSKIKKFNAYGFLSEVFSIFTKHKISINHVTTSEICTSIALPYNQNTMSELIEQLKKIAQIHIENDLVQISIIGDDITQKNILGQISHTVEVPIKSLFLGASKNNISFFVEESHYLETVLKLHKKFVQTISEESHT